MKKNCVILGPSKIEKIKLYGTILDVEEYIIEIAKFLAEHFEQVFIIPDDTLPLKIAKKYKQLSPHGKIIGFVPGTSNGSDHINKFFKFCDEIKETNGGWFNLNTSLTKNSDVVFCFGFSAGVFIELCSIKYNQVYMNLNTNIYIDSRSISSKLPIEVEIDLKNLHYFNNFENLHNEFVD